MMQSVCIIVCACIGQTRLSEIIDAISQRFLAVSSVRYSVETISFGLWILCPVQQFNCVLIVFLNVSVLVCISRLSRIKFNGLMGVNFYCDGPVQSEMCVCAVVCPSVSGFVLLLQYFEFFVFSCIKRQCLSCFSLYTSVDRLIQNQCFSRLMHYFGIVCCTVTVFEDIFPN